MIDTEKKMEVKFENEEMMLTVHDVKEYLKIGKNKAYALFKQADFPAIKINNSCIVMKKDLMQWIDSHKGMAILV